ncbi:MAG: SUF system Fe-S cluster assembly protein [Myxococcales bacterium]
MNHLAHDEDLDGFSTRLAPPPRAPVAADSPLKDRIVDALKTVYDPEIPVDIWELGLIYDVLIRADNTVALTMTLTSPFCPVAGILPGEVEAKVRAVDGVTDVTLELVWDPPWSPELMSEGAKLELGFF